MPPIRFVDPELVTIERGESDIDYSVSVEGERIPSASFRAVFPLSLPDSFVAILNGEGEQVAILKDPRRLDPDSKTLLDAEFERRYFTPRITRIRLLRQEAGMWHFLADSPRGDLDFFVRNWRDSAQEISPGRWHIHSVDGARYEIYNLGQLDEGSRKLLDQVF